MSWVLDEHGGTVMVYVEHPPPPAEGQGALLSANIYDSNWNRVTAQRVPPGTQLMLVCDVENVGASDYIAVGWKANQDLEIPDPLVIGQWIIWGRNTERFVNTWMTSGQTIRDWLVQTFKMPSSDVSFTVAVYHWENGEPPGEVWE